jgi:hypothetical protein
MTLKKYTPILLIGCIVILILLFYSISNPGFISKNSTTQRSPAQMYPAEKISTTVDTPIGTMIINATVPESLTIMPVYRLNMSDRRTINMDRIPLTEMPGEKRTTLTTSTTSLLSEKQAGDIAGKFLQHFNGLPDDATIWKVQKTESRSWMPPWAGYPSPLSLNHTRIIYARTINGQIVDNWGINHEDVGMVADHDFIKVGLREDGDLLYIGERWTRSEYVRDEPVISAREALNRLRHWEHAEDDYGDIRNFEVQTIRQGYYESTGYTSIIEPAWFFSGVNKHGFNQTVVVLSRKNGSELLPFYDGSHPDPSLPDEWAGRKEYENWIRENYVNGTLSMEQAIEIVKKFSGNSHPVIENTSVFYDDPECSGKYTIFPRTPLYNITTNEGIYVVDSRISVVRSVTYPENISHTRKKPVEYPQILNISVDYLRERFGDYSIDYLARNPDVTENPGTYSVRIPVANSSISLGIDKKTGDVISYTNSYALPWTIC